MHPYLIVGSGAGLPVDDFLGHDPSGRFVAVRQGACLDVIDTKARTATRLPDADLREADPTFGRPRAVSFDADGTRMLYIKGGVPRPELVVRDSGAGHRDDVGSGSRKSLARDAGSRGELGDDRQPRRQPMARRRHLARAAHLSGRGGLVLDVRPRPRVRPPGQRVIPATGGPAQEVPGLIRPFGRDLLVRDPDGALGVVSGDGQRLRTLVPADCHARVAHVDGKRGVVVAACARQDCGSLELYGGGDVVVLGSEKVREEVPLRDCWDDGRPRFARLAEGTLVDSDPRALASKLLLAPQEARVPDWGAAPAWGLPGPRRQVRADALRQRRRRLPFRRNSEGAAALAPGRSDCERR